MQPKEFPTNYV